MNPRLRRSFPQQEAKMDERKRDEKDEDLPHRYRKEIEAEAEKSRRALDQIPEHGKDPFNEGP